MVFLRGRLTRVAGLPIKHVIAPTHLLARHPRLHLVYLASAVFNLNHNLTLLLSDSKQREQKLLKFQKPWSEPPTEPRKAAKPRVLVSTTGLLSTDLDLSVARHIILMEPAFIDATEQQQLARLIRMGRYLNISRSRFLQLMAQGLSTISKRDVSQELAFITWKKVVIPGCPFGKCLRSLINKTKA